MGDSLKRFVVIVATTLALAGCTSEPPAPSEKVQAYYDEHVVGQEAGIIQPATVSVIGDSYAAGAGAGDTSQSWMNRVALAQGWGINNVARGGTGYWTSVSTNAEAACGLDYCPSYAEMIDAAVERNPSVIVVAGGRNDATVPAEDEAAAIGGFYQQLRAAAPDAQIIALNALWDDGPAPRSLGTISADVKASVESVGGTYLDIGQPLEARPDLISSDGVHPNRDGHNVLFNATTTALINSGITG